jgi:hypothetical protein
MTAAHGADSGPEASCTANSCFGPGVTNESGHTYLFTAVITGTGTANTDLITGYQQNFASNTPMTAAEQEVAQWLPRDAALGPEAVDHDSQGNSCAQVNVTSPTLGKLFSSHGIGNPQGVIGVEFSYIDSNLNMVYDPANVQDATVSLGPDSSTDSC